MGTSKVKVDFSEIRKAADTLSQANTALLLENITNELGARLLAKAIKRTPVYKPTFGEEVKYKTGKRKGQVKLNKDGTPVKDGIKKVSYKKNGETVTKEYSHTGGTLRRGWDASIGARAVNTGGGYTVTITNSVEYASYVEFGHRQTPGRYVPAIGKSLKKSWVTGQFFLTKAELELEKELPKIIEKKLEAWIKEVLGG